MTKEVPPMAHEVKKAYVYKDSDDEFRVFPPVIVLGAGAPGNNPDKFQLINTTDEDLIWHVGPGAFNAGGPTNEGVDKKKPPQGGGNPKPGKGAEYAPVEDGSYSYVVIMLGSGKKAKGNSDPVIIIDV